MVNGAIVRAQTIFSEKKLQSPKAARQIFDLFAKLFENYERKLDHELYGTTVDAMSLEKLGVFFYSVKHRMEENPSKDEKKLAEEQEDIEMLDYLLTGLAQTVVQIKRKQQVDVSHLRAWKNWLRQVGLRYERGESTVDMERVRKELAKADPDVVDKFKSLGK